MSAVNWPTQDEINAWENSKTPPWDGYEDEETHVCSKPGCGALPFDDGAPLQYFTVLTCPGEEGYSEVTQALCMRHSEETVRMLQSLGFVSHNHHGTCTLSDEKCGGYVKCPTPNEYGAELVQPRET